MKRIIYLSGIYLLFLLLFSGCEKANADTEKEKSETKDSGSETKVVSHFGSENGYQFIDLGLTVKWATYNVGATKPEEFGSYFAWGETEQKEYYDWDTYKWCNNSNDSLTKYCYDEKYGNEGFTDTLKALERQDDVAHVKWGGSWRMPTIVEMLELIKQCDWEWYDADNTVFNGVAGYKVTSFKEGFKGRFIFLPAAGYHYGRSLYDEGFFGGYWTSSIGTDLPYYALNLFSASPFFEDSFYTRQNGLSVRPVCP